MYAAKHWLCFPGWIGKEFFVGISERTNLGGARAVAAAFPEFPCTPVKVFRDKSIVAPSRIDNLFLTFRTAGKWSIAPEMFGYHGRAGFDLRRQDQRRRGGSKGTDFPFDPLSYLVAGC